MINPYTKNEVKGQGNAVDIIKAHGLLAVFRQDHDQYYEKYNDWK